MALSTLAGHHTGHRASLTYPHRTHDTGVQAPSCLCFNVPQVCTAGGQSNPVPLYKDDTSRFWRKGKERTPSSRAWLGEDQECVCVGGVGREAALTKTARMRDRARGCHKRRQDLGRKEVEGTTLAGTKPALGQGPGQEA